MEDEPDPLLYLEKCNDFLALNPLTDEELMATLRNVLHGTARDWRNWVRLNTHTWSDFREKFCAAFLSEDYEDELAERVRTRVQGEGESIRDFAFSSIGHCTVPYTDPFGRLRLDAVQESHLEEHVKPQLHNLLLNNVDVCTTKVGRTEMLRHQIFLTNPVPIRQKSYRISPPKQKVLKELIEDMLKDDVIEPSCSALASPVVLIPKKEGKPRFCVDYRKVEEPSNQTSPVSSSLMVVPHENIIPANMVIGTVTWDIVDKCSWGYQPSLFPEQEQEASVPSVTALIKHCHCTWLPPLSTPLHSSNRYQRVPTMLASKLTLFWLAKVNTDELNAQQASLGQDQESLMQDVPTRWNSTFEMIKPLRRNRDPLHTMLTQQKHNVTLSTNAGKIQEACKAGETPGTMQVWSTKIACS
ncbi:hypothetical protein JOB18_044254 [Solea senegalensis]|uniref:Retrotransposon gag domain-containing protein n=1 Tax=Solea senegalensis TaxID=28829 RepID=A0AAV6PZJ8_SOLSE|nr:hypothetical protein JOB18_044254 [Solea senegalensis]